MSTYTLNGTTSGNWDNTANWTKSGGGTGYPGQVSGDIAYFTSSSSLTIPTIGTLTLQSFKIFSDKSSGSLMTLAHNSNITITDISMTGTTSIGISSSTNSIDITSITMSVNLVSSGSNMQITSVIKGTSGIITKLGLGKLTLSGTNSYSGGTNINNGIISVGSAQALSTSGTISFGGGTLQYTTSANDYSSRFSTAASQQYNIDVAGANSTNFAGALVSSGGTLTKTGTGTLILTGANTYSGNTIITTGTLLIGTGGTTGSLSGNIINNAALIFNRSDNINYSGIISGTGTLSKSGTGTLTLLGNNSYDGNTIISTGTVILNRANTSVYNGSVSLSTSTGLDLSSVNNFNMNGDISGTGTLTKSGSGTVRLGGNNYYTGNTTINAGTLIFNYKNGITYPGTITNASYIDISSVNTFDISGSISGNGILAKSGSGTVTLSGNNTFSGGININLGTLTIGSTSGIGSSGTISFNGGILKLFDVTDYSSRFSNASSQQYNINTNGQSVKFSSSLTSSGGTLTKSGLGTLSLYSSNTYSGDTIINSGTLTIGNGGTSGYITGNVSNNSALIFDRSNNINYSGIISGTGTLNKNGAGTLTLSGNNIYTGLTTINTGILSLTKTFAKDISINSGCIFDLSSNLDTSYAGIISGAGSLTKNGSGTATLFGANTYSGTTTVNAGTLSLLNGSLASNTTIKSGATLSGNGTISGTTQVLSGGNLNIGASPGTFTFTDLDLSAGSNTIITIYGPSYEYPPTLHSTYPKDFNAIDHHYITNLLTINPTAQFTIIFDVPSDINLVQYIGGGAYTWTKVFEAKNTTYTLPLNVTYPTGATINWWTFDLTDGSSNLGISDEITLTYWARLACLTEKTKVLTPNGYIEVNQLNEGDYVLTNDNRKVKITKLLKSTILSTKKTRPYIIPKGSIGINYPPEEIKLSGGHLIKYNDKWILPKTAGIFEQDKSGNSINYYHIKLENYETDNLVINGGTIVESMGDRTFTNVYKERMNNLMIFDKMNIEFS